MTEEKIIEIGVERIKPNPFQPRRMFLESEIIALSNSIKANGLLSPVVVRENNDFYELACGERRLRAVKLLGNKTILCIVRRLTNTQMAEIGLTENLQREDLNPIEEAQGYQTLQKEFNYTQEQIAEKVSKSRVHIANKLRLLNLCNLSQIYIKHGIMTSAHGEALLNLKDKEVEYAFSDLVSPALYCLY